jgi:hypothetical protein
MFAAMADGVVTAVKVEVDMVAVVAGPVMVAVEPEPPLPLREDTWLSAMLV